MTKHIFLLLLLVLFVLKYQARAPFPDLTTSAFEQQCLSRTNYYRGLHQNTPNVTVSSTITNYAKARCQNISQYSFLSAGHANLSSSYGENLYWGGSTVQSTPNCSKAIDAWYKEVANYNYATGQSNGGVIGHFTQLVWAATTQIGCAVCGGFGGSYWETYIVCDYAPPGNYYGQYTANVHPLK